MSCLTWSQKFGNLNFQGKRLNCWAAWWRSQILAVSYHLVKSNTWQNKRQPFADDLAVSSYGNFDPKDFEKKLLDTRDGTHWYPIPPPIYWSLTFTKITMFNGPRETRPGVTGLQIVPAQHLAGFFQSLLLGKWLNYHLVMTNIAMVIMVHRNRWFTELKNGWNGWIFLWRTVK